MVFSLSILIYMYLEVRFHTHSPFLLKTWTAGQHGPTPMSDERLRCKASYPLGWDMDLTALTGSAWAMKVFVAPPEQYLALRDKDSSFLSNRKHQTMKRSLSWDFLENAFWDQRVDSMGRGAYCRVWRSEFDPQDTQGGRRELTPLSGLWPSQVHMQTPNK